MVIGAFPIAKLGGLILKQISKPIANVVKDSAKESPVFRKYVCIPPAHFYNWCEVKLKMWILNLGKPVNIPVLNEAMAIELGSNLLGEGVIFLIGAGILLTEYTRSSRKEAAKEKAKREEMTEIQNTLKELFLRSEEHAARIRELSRQLAHLDTRLGTKDPRQPLPPPPLPESSPPPGSSPPPESPPPESPPPSPSPESSPPPNSTLGDKLSQKDNSSQNSIRHDPSQYGKSNPFVQYSLILAAVDDVEKQFWQYPLIEREQSPNVRDILCK